MKKKLTFILIEDNYLSQEEFKILIKPYDFLECIGICDNAISAINFLNKQKPHLIFLDIEMPDINGMELLPIIDKSIKVIITSCSLNYAVDSYLYNVVDYLHKPITSNRLSKTISKIILQVESEESWEKKTTNNLKSYILVKGNLFSKKIYFSDIILCKANGNNVIIKRDDNHEFKFNGSLKKALEILDANEFVRINKSIIISLNKIKHILVNNIELINNNIYQLSDEYSVEFNNKLMNYKRLNLK